MENRSSKGFAAVALIAAVLLTLVAGLGGGYWYSNRQSTADIKRSPQKFANLTDKESTSTTKQVKTGQEITEATPIPTPTSTPTPIPTSTPKPTVASSELSLTATPKEGAVYLTWSFKGSAPNGFKVTMSTNSNPTYPSREGDEWQYLSSSDVNSYTWSGLTPGTTYHFRVGVYTDGKVSLYSNDVSAVPSQTSSSQNTNNALNLTVTSNETGKVKLNWSVDNASGNGFKTVYSKESNPTYPQNTWHYLDNSRRDDTFDGLPSGEKYHFRVGIYVGGDNPISKYSNDVEVTVK